MKQAHWIKVAAWTTLLISALLTLYKVRLTSDSLFLDDLTHNLFVEGGHWKDWRFTPAPAYLPDVVLYFISYYLLPTATLRIFFVSFVQVIMLATACTWLARRISASLSPMGYAAIVTNIALITWVADCSNMWLYFYTTNNHFASLFFSLIVIGLLLDYLESGSWKAALGIVVLGACAKASTPVFLLHLTIPASVCLLICLALSFLRNTFLSSYKSRLFQALVLLCLAEFSAAILSHILTYNDPLQGRIPTSIHSAILSLSKVLLSLAVAFDWSNPVTALYSFFILFVFYFFLYKVLSHFQIRLSEPGQKNISFALQLDLSQSKTWQFNAVVFFLIILIPSNTFLAVISGGILDVMTFRYFTLPVVLLLMVWILHLDSTNYLTARKNIIVIAGLFLACLLSIPFLQKKINCTPLRQFVYTGATWGHEELIAAKLVDLYHQRIPLRSGVSSYWTSRTVALLSGYTVDHIFADLGPRFYMSSISAIRAVEDDRSHFYNFAIVFKENTDVACNSIYPNGFYARNAARFLPSGYEIHSVPDTNFEIWFYPDDRLDKAVKNIYHSYLNQYPITQDLQIPGDQLPGLVGSYRGAERIARKNQDKSGFLISIPYLNLGPGKFRITLNYSSPDKLNGPLGAVEIMDRDRNSTFPPLPEDLARNVYAMEDGIWTQIIEVSDEKMSSPLSLRLWYYGSGDLSIKFLKIQKCILQ